MKKSIILIIISLLFSVGIQAAQKYHVIGYLPSWKNWSLNSIDPHKLTAIHFSFLKIHNGEVIFGDDSPEYTFEENLIRLQYLKKINPDLDLIISIGGWGVDGFSQLAANEQSRVIFAQSVVNFIESYNFDGVDIDWEFPIHGGWGVIESSPHDRENLVLLVEEIRNQLNILEQQQDREYSLSLAVGAGTWVVEGIDFKALELNVDYFAVMSYNFAGVFSDVTRSHVNLFRGKSYWSINDTVEIILDTGVNRNLLILGIAFYGRYHANVENYEKHGLYQRFSGDGGYPSVSYGEIKNNYLTRPDFRTFFDKETKATHLYSKEEQVFISYHDAKSIKELIKYVRDKKLGGVFIWELTQDHDSGSLLNYTDKYINSLFLF